MSYGGPNEVLLRLLFVVNAPITGGAERHTFDLAADLAALNCQSTVFAIKDGPIEPPPLVCCLQPGGQRRLTARIGDLRRLVMEHRPHVLVSVNERPVLVTALARVGQRPAPPHVAIMHSTILNNWRERALQVGYNPLFNTSDSVVFVSDKQRAYWAARRMGVRNGIVIANGVDLERFSPEQRAALRTASRNAYGFHDEDLVLGICAVMRPEKNHLQLVESVARLRRRGLQVKALFVGDGPCRSLVEARIRDLGLTGAVQVTGMAQDVRPLLAALDIGVLCSISIETLSLAALEIMAMGVPMLMSDIGGASELVDGENGRLFPLGDDEALDHAIISFADPMLRQRAGLAARHHVERQFDRRRMVAAYRECFLALRGASRRQPYQNRIT